MGKIEGKKKKWRSNGRWRGEAEEMEYGSEE